jgi:hypothetical protein
MAVHSLHHVVELEHLYGEIARSIDPGGVFLVNDMVGRNGHVRWPEAAEIIHRIWEAAPGRCRYNHSTKQVDDVYPDLDCSVSSFEGIRSEDVLPLLVHRCHPDVCVTFGNVIDPFGDRVYGRNFDPDNPADTAFIDAVAQLDDAALDLAIVTPTHLIGSFRPTPVPCRFVRQRSPERTVGDPRRVDRPDWATIETELHATRARYEALRSRRAVRTALTISELRHKALGLARRQHHSART